MTLSDKLTRDQVRDAITANLTYSQIQPNDIMALEGFLCIEYARHERMGEHMEMRPSYRKATQPEINPASTGGIEDAYLRVTGFYFSAREAVSFNADGFIGIAGWADDTNVQPFLRALMRWLKEWMNCTRGIPRSAIADPAAYAAALAS